MSLCCSYLKKQVSSLYFFLLVNIRDVQLHRETIMAPPTAANEDGYILNRDWRAMARSVVDNSTSDRINCRRNVVTNIVAQIEPAAPSIQAGAGLPPTSGYQVEGGRKSRGNWSRYLVSTAWLYDHPEIMSRGSMWPIDLLHELPFSVSVDAIDISLAQCPPKPWLPKSLTLISHDVYQPFPSHMLGIYDLVHVQNWLCIWRDETSETLITNLTALLSTSFRGTQCGSTENSEIFAADIFFSHCS